MDDLTKLNTSVISDEEFDDIELLRDVDFLLKVATSPLTAYTDLNIKSLNYLLKKGRYFIKTFHDYYWCNSFWLEVEEKFHLEESSLFDPEDDGLSWVYVRREIEFNINYVLELEPVSLIFALSPLTHPSVLEGVVENTLEIYNQKIIENQKISELEELLIIFKGVASNQNTSSSTLDNLAKNVDLSDSGWIDIEERIRANPNTLVNTLTELSSLEYHFELARNYSISSILKILSKHQISTIRLFVAENPNTSIDVLEELLKDPVPKVRWAAKSNPTISNQKRSFLLAANDPKTSHRILKELAVNQEPEIRIAVASNSKSSATLLKNLAQDCSTDVRLAVASNLKTSTNIFKKLAQDDDEEIRLAVFNNLSTPLNVKEQIEKDEQFVNEIQKIVSNSSLDSKQLKKLAKHKNWKIRQIVASNPNTEIEVLQELAQDKNLEVRVAIAANCKTAAESLEILKLDEEFVVREAVAKNLNLSLYSVVELLKDNDSDVIEAACDRIQSVFIEVGNDAASDWLEAEGYEFSVCDLPEFSSANDFLEHKVSYIEIYEACGFGRMDITGKESNEITIEFSDKSIEILKTLSEAIDEGSIELEVFFFL